MTLKPTKHFIDQLDRKVEISSYPNRIISLVPSQTELLFDLGLHERIIGVTKFCVHPKDECRKKINIGGTKKLHIDKIKGLKPDLIIANKEENTKEDVEELAQQFPVWISDIATLEDAYIMMEQIGNITNTEKAADKLVNDIKKNFELLIPLPPIKILYLIWHKPLMGAGKGTFIDELLNRCGFINVVTEERYPEVQQYDPELVMLSSEPFPFKEKHIKSIQEIYPDAKIELVDGELFSWYGSRLKFFPDYVNSKFSDLRSSQKPG
ncbi:MAG: helical backbone metal receptor [Candidatus Cyclobacteriaceae bacterium M2_1C_046]